MLSKLFTFSSEQQVVFDLTNISVKFSSFPYADDSDLAAQIEEDQAVLDLNFRVCIAFGLL